jgi:hypothetical protein
MEHGVFDFDASRVDEERGAGITVVPYIVRSLENSFPNWHVAFRIPKYSIAAPDFTSHDGGARDCCWTQKFSKESVQTLCEY